jgi:hypothetical protein
MPVECARRRANNSPQLCVGGYAVAMLGISDVVLAPWRAGRLVVRAAEDLNALAERARRDPDPVEEVHARLDALLVEIATIKVQAATLHGDLGALHALAERLMGGLTELIATARSVDGTGQEIVVGGQDLTDTAKALDVHALELIRGGSDLHATAKALDGHSVELIEGGSDLTAVSEELEAHLRVFRAVLPRLLETLDTVDHLEDAVDTVAESVEPLTGAVESVAETVEPLAGAAEGVGRITKRLSRRPKDDDAPRTARVRNGA